MASFRNSYEGSLWRRPDFMKLWAGMTISMFGSYFTGLALSFIAAVALNATPIEMGILATARTAPSLLIGLFAGVWVDRHRRRSLMIAADLGRALILVTIPAVALAGALSIYQLYAVGFAVGTLGVFFDVAAWAYLPSLVGRSQLVEGNSKLEIGNTTAQVAGPSLAGFIIQAITAPLAIALDVLSYLIRAFLVYRIKRPDEAPEASHAPMLVQVREGLAFIFRTPTFRAIISCSATSQLSASVYFALWVLFGTRELGLDAAALGLIFGIGSIGAPLGAMLAARVAARAGLGIALILASLVGAVEFLPATIATPGNAVPLLVLSGLLGSLGWTVYNVNQISLRQAITPFALQGRMNATVNFVVWGLAPLGAMIGGALAQMFGLREAIIMAALISLLSFPWVLFSPVRRLTQVPEGIMS